MTAPPRERINIGQATKGRWKGLLESFGVDPRFLTGKHGPCPLCQPGGAGTDRFRFDDKDGRGTFFCSANCGSGDGVAFLMKLKGWEFKEAAREIEKHLGLVPQGEIRVRNGPDVEAVKRDMANIWKAGLPITQVKATVNWWSLRCGTVPAACPDLRGTEQLTFPNRREVFSGMIAKVRDKDGRWVNLHRTFIAPDGFKAEVPEARMVMALPMPDGIAVRLTAPAPTMGVAEGIETAVSVTELFGVPCWATLNAQALEKFEPPAECERLVIYGDHDVSHTGQAAAHRLAKRLHAGKRVKVDVKLPEAEGFDWNDVLVAKREKEPAT